MRKGMKRLVVGFTSLAAVFCTGIPVLASGDSCAVVEQTVCWPIGAEESEQKEATTYRYTPADFEFRGNSTPVIFVLGDGTWTEDTANETLIRGGFDQMAEEESGHIVFVNPSNGESWTEEDYSLMQNLATNITDDYTYELDLEGTYDTGVSEEGYLYAGRFRSYTFAEGSAQDFVKTYLDTPDATYTVVAWGSDVDGFGAGFHYADSFTQEDNLAAWETLRRTNRLSMSDGYSYLDEYSVYADYGIEETLNDFTAKSGNSFEYYQYIPATVDVSSTTEKYPLVFVFHGGGQHPDGYIHLMNWPVIGSKYGFITVAVNGQRDDEDILDLLDTLQEKYPIDAGRVYASGYSMGGVKSWSLGIEHSERFAAIAPTEAVPGGGTKNPGEFPHKSAPEHVIPTFFVGGEAEFLPVFPMDTPSAITVISLIAEANGFDYDATYNETLDKYYGIASDRSYTYDRAPEAPEGAGIWTLREIDGKDGVPNTILSSVSNLGHSAFMPEAERIWKFFTQFSRVEDGSSVYHPTPWADVEADSWYETAAAHVYVNGIMDGEDGMFAPEGGLTADVLANALYAVAGTPEAENAIEWAAANDLPTGTSELTYGEVMDALNAFGDMREVDCSEVMSDLPAECFGADTDVVTRCEAAVILMNLNLAMVQ